MSSRSKHLGLIVVVLLVVGAIVLLQNPLDRPQVEFVQPGEGTSVGDTVPAFSLHTEDGEAVDVRDFEGQHLLINAWAAWCPFCLAEMPDLQAVSDQHDDVTVLFVHRTRTEDFSAAESFLADFAAEGTPITDPILLDEDDSFYATFFGVGMPVTLFVDKNGVIQFKKVGPMDAQEINDKIEDSFRTTAATPIEDADDIQLTPDGTKYLIDLGAFLSGGPPKDGIPSIDNPQFESREAADDWLPDEELGLGIEYKGETRFYPFRILVSHEIVNDDIQGDPILITYCPLCFTGIGFIRELDGRPVEFGVSGKLYNSELVMYDRATDSYWPQSLGKAVVGPSTGKIIEKVPTDTVFWGDWKAVHPDTLVLSRDTGFLRSYSGANPYGEFGNFRDINLRFPLEHDDPRLPAYDVVYGIEVDGMFKAYSQDALSDAGVIDDELAGVPVTVTWDADLKSARATADGDLLVVETLFWFAWAAFHPDTEVHST